MPANARSLTLTDAYRSRLLALGDRVEAQARQRWPTIEQLDETDWPEAMATSIARAQTEGARLSAGYLTAFLRSETGRGTARAIDSKAYAGVSRDGRPLAEALRSPLIGVLAALKNGKTPEEALETGLERGLANINLDVLHAARSSLNDLMEAEERVVGWQRGVKGTCGACGGDIAVEVSVQLPGVPLMVHPNCQCTTVPVVTRKSRAGVIFDGLTAPMQKIVDDLAERYPGVVDRAWFDPDAEDIGQLAGVSNGQIRVSAKFLDDDYMNVWRKDFRSVQVGNLETLEGARRSVLTHEFGHTLEKRLVDINRGAWDELHAYVNESVTYQVGGKSVTAPRWQAGDLSAPSAYASESRYEYIAEALNDWIHNGLGAGETSQHIGRIIDGALKK